jgi:uncharacterized membrane protein
LAERTTSRARPAPNAEFAVGLMRAFGGAIIFAFPLLMTMEMWQLGFAMDRLRLLVFLVLNFGVLVGLSYFVGFEKALGFWDILMDALAAYGVGVIASAAGCGSGDLRHSRA